MQDSAHNLSLLARLVNALYPSACPVCGNPSDTLSHSPICRACWSTIEPYTGPACCVCAKPFASPYSTICGECLKRQPYFDRGHAFGIYAEALREAIHRLKFFSVRRLAGPLGSLMASSAIVDGADVVVPVPMTQHALRQRGYNQAALLARPFARAKDIPLRTGVLVKVRETEDQAGLSQRARLLNVRNAFGASGSVKGMRVVLVDDVITTGATANECSRALKKAGADEVTVVALARTF